MTSPPAAPPAPSPGARTMTRAQAAAHLGVSIRTLDRYLADDLLPAVRNRHTRSVKIDAAAVERLAIERAA